MLKPTATMRTASAKPRGQCVGRSTLATDRHDCRSAARSASSWRFASRKPRLAAVMGRQLLGKLVAAPISVALVLGVHIGRLLEDLARKLLVVEVRLLGRVRRHPRAVDSDRLDAHHASD